jgi:DNA mismatch repair ATPase MutS
MHTFCINHLNSNGSGKSTYLKQIALIVILAHCGSYVPAEEALLPIRDQICTRIGTADDQEHNISTFLMEMKETAFICNSTTEKSLFLLDELGRATSNEDGVAVAWAVSEFLLTKRAMTFFVTHYPQISKLASVYPNVQNQHLGSCISTSRNEDGSSISYTHKIMPGPCMASGDYGVEMSGSCGFPSDVVENARRIRQLVQEKVPGADLCEHENNDSINPNFAENRRNAHNILCDLAKHLTALKESEGRLNNDAKRTFLQVRAGYLALAVSCLTILTHSVSVCRSRSSDIVWFQPVTLLW